LATNRDTIFLHESGRVVGVGFGWAPSERKSAKEGEPSIGFSVKGIGVEEGGACRVGICENPVSEDGENGPTHLGLVSSVGYVIFFSIEKMKIQWRERVKGFEC
jgi:hypothetical protein